MAQKGTKALSVILTKAPENDSSFKSLSWAKLSPAWKVTRDLWGTALDIRELGKEYLTQFPRESATKYSERLNKSVFNNVFRETIETMAGLVFRRDPSPQNLHSRIEPLMTDIDLAGNTFWDFCVYAFERYLRDGNGFIYVDAPEMSEGVKQKIVSGVRPTLADRLDDRPFWVYFEASQLINYRTEKIGSRFRFTQATIESTVMLPKGAFGEEEVLQHLILRPGSFQVVRANEKGEFTNVVKEGETGLEEIPLYPINSDLANVPPLLTLGLLNILNYNQKSDYDDICHLVCTPLRVHKYETAEDAKMASQIRASSPGIGIKLWGKESSVSYAEVSGGGMQLARDRYQDVEKEMADIGIGMLSPSDLGAVRTATEIMDTASRRQSKLAKRAREFSNAVEKALYGTAQYIQAIHGKSSINLDEEEREARLKIIIDYDRLTFSSEELAFFESLVESGKLSIQTFLEWLPQVMDMPPGFDPKEELKRIAAVNSLIEEELD